MANYLTVSCKLNLTPAQTEKVEETLSIFSAVCTYIHEYTDPSIRHKLRLQSTIYHEVRSVYPSLPADLVVAAMGRVSENRKSAKERGRAVKKFRPTSASINTKAFRLIEQDWTLSINLVGGREKRIPLAIGAYQRERLAGRKPVSAVLLRRRSGGYYLNIQVALPVPTPVVSDQVMGVSFGVETIATLSTGEVFSNQNLHGVRERFVRVRSSLQRKASKGTRTSRRNCRKVMKRLSGRERRFASWVNHNVSAAIVSKAKSERTSLAVEDLTRVRDRMNERVKDPVGRRRVNSWSFAQLRSFIEYKAAAAGVHLIAVNGGQKGEGKATRKRAKKIEILGAARKPAWKFAEDATT